MELSQVGDVITNSTWSARAEAHMNNNDSMCIGCGVDPVIEVNDRKLCGNCFLLGISVSLQPPSSDAQPGPSDESYRVRELRSSLLTAIDEIERLRSRLDELVRENASLRRNDAAVFGREPGLDRRPED
ncbi:MAG: hypothetical protein LC732_08530 [Acidobacteria bacterium]|nr:hypothetical protein [Acidobacteriota bacterium]